ncbi:MAG: hydroxymethylbilane synthase [Simkaniaceae bacterium]|nr:hydroxymethylbilane synthase [Simkaniaceae bacterium]
MEIFVGARDSRLSRAQVKEIEEELKKQGQVIHFKPVWIETPGDRDLTTSLTSLDKTDFFTKDIDHRQLRGEIRVAIHSAKDLPDPLPKGLRLVALTEGLDSSDVLVLRKGDKVEGLPPGAKIGTSSLRRIESLKELRSDLLPVDIRGTIDQRLLQLITRQVDGVILAKAALIRLNFTGLNTVPLNGPTAAYQGRLAVIAREDDADMSLLFSLIHTT